MSRLLLEKSKKERKEKRKGEVREALIRRLLKENRRKARKEGKRGSG